MSNDGPKFPQLDRLSRYRDGDFVGRRSHVYRRAKRKGDTPGRTPDVVQFIEGDRPVEEGDDE